MQVIKPESANPELTSALLSWHQNSAAAAAAPTTTQVGEPGPGATTLTAAATPAANMEDMARAAFQQFDADGTGHMDAAELGQLTAALGYTMEGQALQDLIGWLDKSGDGQVDEGEFLAWWTSGGQ